MVIPDFERKLYQQLCEDIYDKLSGAVLRSPRCTAFDLVISIPTSMQARSFKKGGTMGPRMHKVRSMRYSPFARYTLFLDNDATLTPLPHSILKVAVEKADKLGIQIALSRESAPVWHVRRRLLSSGLADQDCPQMRKHHPREKFVHVWVRAIVFLASFELPWTQVIPEMNSGTILYTADSLQLFFQRWEHYIAGGGVLNPTPSRDQKALLLAYEDTLPSFVTLDSLGIVDPRSCCPKCQSKTRKRQMWCQCVACHAHGVTCDETNVTALATLF